MTRRPPRWLRLTLGHGAILIALVRILSTYPVFNQTYDEPISVACGMEWLNGSYRYDPKHPPLGRVAAALGSYLTGNRGGGRDDLRGTAGQRPELRDEDARDEGNAILQHGDYWRNISLARFGLLPFFVLACLAVWGWTAWAAGPVAGVLAVVLFTLLPPVLGHAGLAMTDVALLGTFNLALCAWCWWLDRPSARRSLLLGAAAALAILSKLVALLFLPVCGLLVAGAYVLRGRHAEWRFAPSARLRGGAIALGVCAVLIWAGYRFSFHHYGDGGHAGSVERALDVPIPAPEFVEGVIRLWQHNQESHYNIFLGHHGNTGWLYYYPVVLAVKTPAALWVLFALGLLALRRGNWRIWALVLPAAGILLVALLSHINTGVRHILPIYGALAAVAAIGSVQLLRSSWRVRGVCALLVLWFAVESALAHPDYLAYFNEFADGSSGRFGVDSDLDYGQDLARLGSVCQRRGIGGLSLAYYGTANPERLGLPPHHRLAPGTPASGWVAISVNKLKLGDREDNPADYAWLEQFRPVARVGKSILLYDIPEKASAPALRTGFALDSR